MGNEEDETQLHDELSSYQRLATDRPTATQTNAPDPPVIPSKPKIVVLGASGKIGRLVVRHLLEMTNLDATIVAFCRDYDKACRVLYDDMVVAKCAKKGPKLQIVQGDLVPQEDLPGFENNENRDWLVRAKSAASFYGNSIEHYNNQNDAVQSRDEALEDAIRGCTAIISCVGSVRRTNLWTDYLERPLWRLLRPDVSDWCKDARHPFYVHYRSTRKALQLAEIEQLRREAVLKVDQEKGNSQHTDRIRFVRISDLVCSQQAWSFVPLVANILHSMVFRYQYMAELALEASPLIDTITIRPGDLVDEFRDEDTTSLQINPSGTIGCPSRIGRDDVAEIAVAATLYEFSQNRTKNERSGAFTATSRYIDTPTFHHTLACRWVCENMDPYPAQGKKSDGYPNANACLKAAFQSDEKQARNGKSEHAREDYPESKLHATQLKKLKTFPSRIKPYGVYVAISVYFVIALMCQSLMHFVSQCLPITKFLFPAMIQTIIAFASTLDTTTRRIAPILWNRIKVSRLLQRQPDPKYIPF